MKMYSEFESFYHAIIYYLNTLILNEPQSWRDLSNALYNYTLKEEFDIPTPLSDALLDDSHDDFFELFTELNSIYSTKLTNMPYVDFSSLEKHYLRWVLDQPRIRIFMNEDTVENLKAKLNIEASIFNNAVKIIHQKKHELDEIDFMHLRTVVNSIKENTILEYRYVDDEGNSFSDLTRPIRLQYNMQADLVYLVHQPLSLSAPIKGLIRRFSFLKVVDEETDVLDLRMDNHSQGAYDQEDINLKIRHDSPQLRKALVEFSVFEREIIRSNEYYHILIKCFPFDMDKLMTTIRSLQPEIILIGPEHIKNDLLNDLKTALKYLI